MSEERSDRELLLAWRAADSSAGEELLARHSQCLYKFLRNKVPDGALDDLAQSTLEACVRGVDNFRGDASFRTYMLQIGRNLVVNFYRKRRLEKKLADDQILAHSVVEMGAGPSTLLAAREEQRLLIEGLRRLPLDDQIVLELYYWESMSAREIAAVYGVVEPTMRGRIRAAKQRLVELIEAFGRGNAALASTVTDIDGWADGVKQQLHERLKPGKR